MSPGERPLDGLERQAWLLGTACAVHSLGIARVRGPLGAKALRAALDAAVRRHPLLGVRVAEAAGGPRFVRAGTPPVPLRVVPRKGPDHWHAAAEEELATPLDAARGPLLRATLLEGSDESDLLLAYDHLLGDMRGCYGLVRDLLDAAAQALDGRAPALPPLPPRASMTDLLPPGARSPGLRLRAATAKARLVWRLLAAQPAVLPRETDAPARGRRTRIVPRRWGPEPTARLAERAKAEGTTVHGALGAALLKAIAAEMPGGRARRLGCISPVNLRSYLEGQPGDEFGFMGVPIHTYHDVGPATGFWDLARAVRGGVQEVVGARRMFVPLLVLEKAAPRSSAEGPALVARADALPLAPASVTNLGRLDGAGPFGPLMWEDFHFAGAMTTGGASITMAAATFRGRLAMNLLHPEPLVSRARATRVADATERHLRRGAGVAEAL